MQFWIISGATMAFATVTGLGLGAYVTSPQPAPAPDEKAAFYTAQKDDSGSGNADWTIAHGPRIIRCKGCGPTLAERRMAADMAGLDADAMIAGTTDPVVRHYLDHKDAPNAPAPTPTPPPTTLMSQREDDATPLVIPTAGADALP